MLATIKHRTAEIVNFIFLGKQQIIALCMQHSPTAAAKTLNFVAHELRPPTIQC